ncbi:unnamed protein product [Sphagnum balticum]
MDFEKFWCNSSSSTLNRLIAIANFLKLHQPLWRAHVVEFFQEKLWEKVDPRWLACLQAATVKDWLLLPSGIAQDDWLSSLKEFVRTAHSLALQRQPKTATNEMLAAPIGSVLAQGMSAKKCHEIAALSSLVANVAKSTETTNVIDVGAGQGYLGLVLSFEYRMAVVAVDACAHHSNVTNERATRIEKHYNAQLHKTQQVSVDHSSKELCVPRTVTCCVGSGETHTALASLMLALHNQSQELEEPMLSTADHNCINKHPSHLKERRSSTQDVAAVLAGLHACGDLSATMLRTFLECKEVKAVINVGCCYNLLTEECSSTTGETTKDSMSGFPLSKGVRHLGLHLGKNGRDLACQSAERWRDDLPEAALRNFESHAFRAALQLILLQFYPETVISNPSVGRIGKARRRRQQAAHRQVTAIPTNQQSSSGENQASESCSQTHASNAKSQDEGTESSLSAPILSSGRNLATTNHMMTAAAAAFEEYTRSALQRLNLPMISKHDFTSVWESVAPYMDFVGPFWSLRAVLAPVLESYILLDRLLYLEEHSQNNSSTTGQITAELVPLFEPSISPRNMVIIACRQDPH